MKFNFLFHPSFKRRTNFLTRHIHIDLREIRNCSSGIYHTVLLIIIIIIIIVIIIIIITFNQVLSLCHLIDTIFYWRNFSFNMYTM